MEGQAQVFLLHQPCVRRAKGTSARVTVDTQRAGGDGQHDVSGQRRDVLTELLCLQE